MAAGTRHPALTGLADKHSRSHIAARYIAPTASPGGTGGRMGIEHFMWRARCVRVEPLEIGKGRANNRDCFFDPLAALEAEGEAHCIITAFPFDEAGGAGQKFRSTGTRGFE